MRFHLPLPQSLINIITYYLLTICSFIIGQNKNKYILEISEMIFSRSLILTFYYNPALVYCVAHLQILDFLSLLQA